MCELWQMSERTKSSHQRHAYAKRTLPTTKCYDVWDLPMQMYRSARIVTAVNDVDLHQATCRP